MKAIWKYLDELIEQGTVKNDSDTARKVGVSRATVSDWRIGKTTPNDEQAVKLASLLRKDAGELLAECGAARAKTPATRQAWERIAARMASYGITVCALVITIGQSEEARAYNKTDDIQRVPVFRIGLGFLIQCFALLKLRYDGVHRFMRYGFQPIGRRMNRAMSALLGHRTVLDRPTYSLAAG